jgi:hypothetical protein
LRGLRKLIRFLSLAGFLSSRKCSRRLVRLVAHGGRQMGPLVPFGPADIIWRLEPARSGTCKHPGFAPDATNLEEETAMAQYSKVEIDGRLLIVTINRPEVYNALHPMANQELSDAFDEFDLARDAVLNSLTTVRFHSPSGRSVAYTSERIEAVAVDRLCFDQQLQSAAAASGAAIVVGGRVDDVHVDRDGVTLELRNGEHARFRTVVLACGANYRLQRCLGLGLPASHLQSAQTEVSAATPGDVEVHFGRQVAPGGFAWVVPVRRPEGWHARVGRAFGVERSNHTCRPFGRGLTIG